MGVGVRTIETDTFQCGSNEAEVALIGQFYAQQVGVAGVFGLGELLVFVVLIGVVTDDLIDDKVIDLLVEDTCADQTDTFEVVVCAEVEIVGDGRGQVGLPITSSLSLRLMLTQGINAEYFGRLSVSVNEARSFKSSFTSYLNKTLGSQLT